MTRLADESALYAIWGLDDEHVLAVGDFGLILRWNGENWTEFQPTDADSGARVDARLLAQADAPEAEQAPTGASGVEETAAPADAAGDTAAVGDASAGADKVAVCVACHGEGGKQPLAPIYPHIAGQSSEYLESALQAYRAGLRQGGMSAMMSPQAAMLSDQDIKDIAACYSEQSMAGDAE